LKIVFFVHPTFLNSQSMPRFAGMLAQGMRERNHFVQVWEPKPRMIRLAIFQKLKKWLGYIDQYLIFPMEVKRRLKSCDQETIFVFVDHALGPWVPLVEKFPHVIHCHDFLAQRSALGEIAENITGWSGKKYQQFIRKGYSKGKHFISVSQKTSSDLIEFLGYQPAISEIVYNGLNQSFVHVQPEIALPALSKELAIDLSAGFILHVGGNQWYKNRKGVLEIYQEWRRSSSLKLPLLMIGSSPSGELSSLHSDSAFKSDIHFVTGLADATVRLAYAAASLMLFPSLAEGFGWPIAEAMASGCLVITTNEAPMIEVAGAAGFKISRRPVNAAEHLAWTKSAANKVEEVLRLSPGEKEKEVEKGIKNIKRFDSVKALDNIEAIYAQILQKV
jgi:glycosyltransferase involved in cell wall biosynthesis